MNQTSLRAMLLGLGAIPQEVQEADVAVFRLLDADGQDLHLTSATVDYHSQAIDVTTFADVVPQYIQAPKRARVQLTCLMFPSLQDATLTLVVRAGGRDVALLVHISDVDVSTHVASVVTYEIAGDVTSFSHLEPEPDKPAAASPKVRRGMALGGVK